MKRHLNGCGYLKNKTQAQVNPMAVDCLTCVRRDLVSRWRRTNRTGLDEYMISWYMSHLSKSGKGFRIPII